ncbi:hypothetical protein PAMA_007833 [Pampus argenteus]
MLFRMKTYLTLLWGIFVLFSMESESASLPETSIISSTAKPNKTTEQLTSAHVLHRRTERQPATRDPTHSPAEVSGPATAETTLSATAEITASATAETTGPATAEITASATETTGPAIAEITASATAENTASATAEITVPATAEITVPATAEITASTITEITASATAETTASATAEITASATAETTGPATAPATTHVTIKLYSPTVSEDSTQAIQNSSSPSTFSTTETTTNTTSEASYVFDPESISSTVTIHETPTDSTAVSSTSQPVSATRSHMISTSYFPDKTRLSTTTESPTSSVLTDSVSSISPAGTLITHNPKRLPIPTTKSTPATTTAPQEASKNPLDTAVQPCSIRGVVQHCLIAIASLAGLATIFIVTTIVLCTRLSARKYKVKRPQQETEMMCISALLPERTYTRQRNPVINGVRVIPRDGDSDEEGSDNLTLSSFLPENDRFI